MLNGDRLTAAGLFFVINDPGRSLIDGLGKPADSAVVEVFVIDACPNLNKNTDAELIKVYESIPSKSEWLKECLRRYAAEHPKEDWEDKFPE